MIKLKDMQKIKGKRIGNKEEDGVETFDSQFELLSMLPKVKSSVKENVTEDYTMAHLTEAEREYIAENYSNAGFAKDIIMRYALKGAKSRWNQEKMEWDKNEDGSIKMHSLSEEDKKIITDLANKTFEFFMISSHMIVILNRNKSENFLVKLLGNVKEEEKEIRYNEDDRNVLQKIRDRISGGDEDEE